ncbi:aminotransferase-like domain-containing protein [Streptomyces sp. NPDC054884]|uniref:aminotransferase-like domain-containing protein n=1 Tax=Streptomyces sp. ME08-AFT2 TaxID=3028683 RepID=UPI0029AC5E86|nr:PLP-dependent aminotransferase family protein [Streptomyces sp. ME08-AFT2]MDX3309166.1 PLP-dependent aminotransferase family protein [Streptomyces sp. ME08-AFT2]
MAHFRSIADRIADDIAAGRLRPGQRLPPQRWFARRHRIAPSTAGRVYGELVRRGLVVGEVGRGTFVRAAPPAAQGRALVETATAAPVNLELNYPSAPGQSELLAPVLAPLLRPDVLTEALRPGAADGTPAAREAAAQLLAVPGWRPEPDRFLFTGNARQAIAAVLASLVRPGGRVGVEELTYPLVKEIAARLGVVLVPLAGDAEGVRPDAIADAHRAAPLSALYLQPTLHNPTSATTSEGRRRELGLVAVGLGLPVVEDRIWSFLHPDAVPLAVHAPGLVHVVDGLSKRVAPGLAVGFLVVPEHRTREVAAAVRSGGWSAGRFAVEAAVRWTQEGVVRRLVEQKRADAARRQAILAEHLVGHLAEHLDGFTVRTDPRAYYAWWELPAPWRAEPFTAAAAAHGIAVTPGAAFAVDPQRTPAAVRLGLASAPERELARALRVLAGVAVRGPAASGVG